MSIEDFEILEHPADIGFRAGGRSLPELFANCAKALIAIIIDPSGIRPRQQFSISAGGSDYESLLVNWLNEVLYYVDGKRLAPGSFEIAYFDKTRIDAVLAGEPRDPHRHPAKLVVKAATYHQLTVRQTGDGWVAEVYLDV